MLAELVGNRLNTDRALDTTPTASIASEFEISL